MLTIQILHLILLVTDCLREKYIDFKTEDSKGSAFRFGINIGYKF